MTSIQLRKATPGDAPTLAELSRQLGYTTTTTQVLDRMKTILRMRADLLLVACEADIRVVGWIHAYISHRIESEFFAELGGLVVAEDLRGRGIGSVLLTAAENWALQQGILKMRIRTRSTRADAHRFYEQQGYSVTKEQHVFDKHLTQEPL